MRLSKDELEKVKEKYGVNRFFSWSKIEKFNTSPYEYFLKSVLHIPEDRNDCVYAAMGGMAHDILEKLYNGKIEHKDMVDEFETAWSSAVDISDLKFDRNDEEHNKKLANKYYDDLKHFYKHYVKLPYKVMTEQFIVTKISDYVLQGYLDVIFKDDNDYYTIIDYKTSSIYRGKTLLEKSGQLCVYTLGLIQKGIPLEKIKTAFNFLKYVTVQYEQANGDKKERYIERCELGSKLQSNAKMWLKKLGYTEQIDEYLKDLVDYNDIGVLPKDVQAKFQISDCYVYIPLTQELLDSWIEKISTTIKDIIWREEQYAKDKNEKWFFDTEDNVKKESYYLATLCGYSPSLHLPYQKYLEKLEESKNGNDLFNGIGTCAENEQVEVHAQSSNKSSEMDLSWLDNLI